MRHQTWVGSLYLDGVDPDRVADLLGDADPRTTSKYYRKILEDAEPSAVGRASDVLAIVKNSSVSDGTHEADSR